jgi:predicted nucleotidyltransferase
MARIDASIAETIKQFLERLDLEGIRVKAAYLFGSFAEGRSNRWSDIDIAVKSSHPYQPIFLVKDKKG